MSGPQDKEVINFCKNFPILNAEAVLADLKSFTFFIKSMVYCGRYKADESPSTKLLKAAYGVM